MNVTGRASTGAWQFLATASTIVGIAGVFGNGLVLYSFLRYKQLRQKQSVYLLGLLSVIDTWTGLSVCLVKAVQLYVATFQVEFQKFICISFFLPAMVGFRAGQLYLLFIAYDRYSLLKDSIEYSKRDSTLYAKRAFLISVSIAVFFVSFVFVKVDLLAVPVMCTVGGCANPIFSLVTSSFFSILGIVTTILYVLTLRRISQKTKVVIVPLEDQADAQRQKNQRAATRTFMCLLAVYVTVFVVPQNIHNIFVFYTVLFNSAARPALAKASFIANFGGTLSVACNAVVYAFKHRTLWNYMRGALLNKDECEITVACI